MVLTAAIPAAMLPTAPIEVIVVLRAALAKVTVSPARKLVTVVNEVWLAAFATLNVR